MWMEVSMFCRVYFPVLRLKQWRCLSCWQVGHVAPLYRHALEASHAWPPVLALGVRSVVKATTHAPSLSPYSTPVAPMACSTWHNEFCHTPSHHAPVSTLPPVSSWWNPKGWIKNSGIWFHFFLLQSTAFFSLKEKKSSVLADNFQQELFAEKEALTDWYFDQ